MGHRTTPIPGLGVYPQKCTCRRDFLVLRVVGTFLQVQFFFFNAIVSETHLPLTPSQ